MAKLRVVQMGMGPIGLRVTEYLAEREGVAIVGAVDIDPAKRGRDVGTLAGLPAPLGVAVTDSLDEALGGGRADAVVLTTTSSLAKTAEQVLALLPYGVDIVSSCEELSYPWLTDPVLAARLDDAAKAAGVSVLGTGINPGYLMDFLPLVATGVCRRVDRVRVERFQNAAFRRLPFQKKIGAGLSPAEFDRKVADGSLRHVGLTESVQMIAATLGWTLDRTEDIIAPVIAETAVTAGELAIPAGHALGVSQTGRGFVGGEEVITLAFRATIGEPEVRDRVVIEGVPGLDMSFAGGVNGDVGTAAILVNAIPAVVRARPGLRTMADIEPIVCYR